MNKKEDEMFQETTSDMCDDKAQSEKYWTND